MFALQYKCNNDSENICAFANNRRLEEGGAHVTGFKTALTRVVNRYARQHELITDADANFFGQAVRKGLTVIISLRLMEPRFGPSWNCLRNFELEGILNRVAGKELAAYFEANPEVARAIIGSRKK